MSFSFQKKKKIEEEEENELHTYLKSSGIASYENFKFKLRYRK
jgi:hypothetical protein